MYHLDLKPANVLLDEKWEPKIADFGLSRLFGEEKTQITKSSLGTRGYVPPEYIDGSVISIKFDIFSLGVIIIKIMTGPSGYFRKDEMSSQQFIELVQLNWRKRLHATSVYPLELYSEQVKRCTKIALNCVEADRSKRPTIGVIVNKLNETETMIQNALRKYTLPNPQKRDTASPVDQPGWWGWGSLIKWPSFQPRIKVMDWQNPSGELYTIDIHQWEPCDGSMPKKQQMPPVAELSHRHGPLMLLRLGKVPTVVISSAEAAALVMHTHDVLFASRPQDIVGCCSNGMVFAPYGSQWSEMRRRWNMDLLGPKQRRRMDGIWAEEVAHLLRSVAAAPSGAVNVSEKVAMLCYDVVSRAVFGSRQDEYVNEFSEVFRLLGGICLVDLFPSSQLVRWLSSGELNMTRSYSHIHLIIADIVDERKVARETDGACSPDEEDMLDVLLRLQEDNSEFLLTTETICVVIFEIFGGATKALATTLEWAILELLNNPKAMAKAQLEVREVLGQDRAVIVNADFGKLHYLPMVIKEVLRLHPPFPLLFPREVSEDCKIMDYDIPKGAHIYVNAFSISRDPAYWDYPEKFNPERFENSPVDFDGRHFDFTPFGAGRRGCPGMQFSASTLELALANLLYHFDWVLPDEASPQMVDMAESDVQLIAIPHPRSKVALI